MPASRRRRSLANSRLPCTNVEPKLQAPFPGVLSIDRKHLDTRLIDEQVARATGEIYAGKICVNLGASSVPRGIPVQAD